AVAHHDRQRRARLGGQRGTPRTLRLMERSREQLNDGLDQVWEGFDRTVSSIRPDEWSRPTPCEEWDVHDLVAHFGGIQGGFEGFPPAPPPDGFATEHEGIDRGTAEAVAARRGWS